jgi:hypothetical protein
MVSLDLPIVSGVLFKDILCCSAEVDFIVPEAHARSCVD